MVGNIIGIHNAKKKLKKKVKKKILFLGASHLLELGHVMVAVRYQRSYVMLQALISLNIP